MAGYVYSRSLALGSVCQHEGIGLITHAVPHPTDHLLWLYHSFLSEEMRDLRSILLLQTGGACLIISCHGVRQPFSIHEIRDINRKKLAEIGPD